MSIQTNAPTAAFIREEINVEEALVEARTEITKLQKQLSAERRRGRKQPSFSPVENGVWALYGLEKNYKVEFYYDRTKEDVTVTCNIVDVRSLYDENGKKILYETVEEFKEAHRAIPVISSAKATFPTRSFIKWEARLKVFRSAWNSFKAKNSLEKALGKLCRNLSKRLQSYPGFLAVRPDPINSRQIQVLRNSDFSSEKKWPATIRGITVNYKEV